MRRSGFRPQEGAHHDAQLYQEFRPEYPPEVFLPWVRALESGARPAEDLRILDLGCGSGQAARAWVQASALKNGSAGVPQFARTQWIGVDPNPEMLTISADSRLPANFEYTAITAPAESIETWLPHGPFSGVVFASSLHWMEPKIVAQALRQSLRPGASIFFVEYQFPRIAGRPDLDLWLKERFRQRWHFSDQKPRGRFRDLVKTWLSALQQDVPSPHLALQDSEWNIPVSRAEFQGLLFSQARVLAAFARTPGERPRAVEVIAANFPSELTLNFRAESFVYQMT